VSIVNVGIRMAEETLAHARVNMGAAQHLADGVAHALQYQPALAWDQFAQHAIESLAGGCTANAVSVAARVLEQKPSRIDLC